MTEQELKDLFNQLISLPGENEWVEFKEAKNQFHSDDFGRYFSALSNEANLKGKEYGWLIFGVVDKTKKIIGTQFRPNRSGLDSLKLEIAKQITNQLTFVEIHELFLSEGRVILFQIPAALLGIPTAWKGHYYGRDGESIGPLNLWEIEQIRNQTKQTSDKKAEHSSINQANPISDPQIEIMDLTLVCHDFPKMPEPEIKRENFLDEIDRIFAGDTQLIVIEAEEGRGKTTLLAQYAKRHPDHAFSLFIRPNSSVAYDIDYLRKVLSEQFHWALNKEPLSLESVDEPFFQTQKTRLQKRALKSRETFYFIVDGLDDISNEDVRIEEIVLKDLLPLGIGEFRFLLTGELKRFADKIHKSVSCTPLHLATFSPNDTEKYLSDLYLEKQISNDIHNVCKGVPGHLASLRRQYEAGNDIQKILDEEPEVLFDFIAMEWNQIELSDNRQGKLLSILAFGRGRYMIADLARILEMEYTTVEELLQKNRVIIINHQKQVSYLSETHRKYAAKQLQHFKEEVTNLLIDDLLKDSNSEVALRDLPTYFEQSERFPELLDFLTPEYFEKLLAQSQSLNPVFSRADLGLKVSQRLNRKEALVRFSMQKSVISQLHGADIWRSEIEARMALEDYGSALVLAQSTPVLKEDQLHLLAVIAKMQRKKGLAVEQGLMEQIRLLYDEIDPKALGEKAIEIAMDLLWSDTNLAITLIEASTISNQDKNALDWAFATLSITALGADREQHEYSDAIEKTRTKIKDPTVQQFSGAASVFFGDYSADEVIKHVKKLDPKNRLFFLRHWALANQTKDGTADVIDYALDVLIKDTSDNTPKTRDLREIATLLPSISDISKTPKLVGRFDSQKGSIEKFGTTEDLIRLQLLLAQTESKYNFTAACNRVFDVYWHIAQLKDLATKSVCWAWLVASLEDIDPEKKLEPKEGLHTEVQNELHSDIKKLLDATAEHYFAVSKIIAALSKHKPELALEFAKSLNTQKRRDLGLLKFTKSATKVLPSKINFPLLKVALNNIVESDHCDESLLNITRRLSEIDECIDPSTISNILPLIDSVQHIQDTYRHCMACCYVYSFLIKQNADTYFDLASDLLRQLEIAWESIDVGWRKVNAGFKIAKILAVDAIEIAQKYLSLTEKLKDDVILDVETPALTYLACVKLAIRAYSGLLPRSIDSPDDMERLTRLINRIPSKGVRAEIWAELALRYFINEHLDTGKRIVTTYVKPLLQDIFEDTAFQFEVQITAAPALFCAHKETALEMISKMRHYKRDEAYRRICDFILHKKPFSDPYEYRRGSGVILSFQDAENICELLELMSIDSTIYTYIEIITDSMALRECRVTQQQKIEIAERLERIITHKLPDYKTIPEYHNIMHDGYKIVAQAQVARIRKVRLQEWDNLLQSANNIPNIADKALVMCMVALAMPSKEYSKQKQVIKDAITLIDSLPADFDRIDRYIALADMMMTMWSDLSKQKIVNFKLPSNMIRKQNKDLVKQCLKSAMEFSVKLDQPELMYSNQKRILDVADRLDEHYAASLASIVDDDPARGISKVALKSHVQFLKCKKEMADPKCQKHDPNISKSYYPKAAWMKLAELNAGVIGDVDFNVLIGYINDAADFPLREAYPILAYIIENAIQRWSKTDHARTLLLPMFEAVLLGAELSGRIAECSQIRLNQVKRYAESTSGINKSIKINPGERVQALQFLQEWFTNEVRDYLKICDPFFGINDLEVLHLLNSANPNCRYHILTSKRQQDHDQLSQPWDEAFQTYWRLKISEQEPPDTEIVIVGTETSGELPIQNRWWLTNGGGIRVGTSFNLLGVTKLSEISILSPEEAESSENEIDQYLQRKKREYNNERLRYNLFTL